MQLLMKITKIGRFKKKIKNTLYIYIYIFITKTNIDNEMDKKKPNIFYFQNKIHN